MPQKIHIKFYLNSVAYWLKFVRFPLECLNTLARKMGDLWFFSEPVCSL